MVTNHDDVNYPLYQVVKWLPSPARSCKCRDSFLVCTSVTRKIVLNKSLSSFKNILANHKILDQLETWGDQLPAILMVIQPKIAELILLSICDLCDLSQSLFMVVARRTFHPVLNHRSHRSGCSRCGSPPVPFPLTVVALEPAPTWEPGGEAAAQIKRHTLAVLRRNGLSNILSSCYSEIIHADWVKPVGPVM